MINLKSKIKKERSISLNITIFLLIILLSITLFFSVMTILDIKDLNSSIYQKRFELETKYLQGLSIKKTRVELDKSRDRLNNISKIILKTENTLNFINDIEKTAEKNNITQTIKLNEFNKPTVPTPQPIQINFTGRYSDILNFIQELDNNSYYLTINKISLNNQGNEVSALIEGNIYWE